jgi:hypothetical protein
MRRAVSVSAVFLAFAATVAVLASNRFTPSASAYQGKLYEFTCKVPERGPVECAKLDFLVEPGQTFVVRYLEGKPKWARIDIWKRGAKERFFTSGEIEKEANVKATVPEDGGKPFKPKIYVDAQGGATHKEIKIRVIFKNVEKK